MKAQISEKEACEMILKILDSAEEKVEDIIQEVYEGDKTLNDLDRALEEVIEDNMQEEMRKITNEKAK